MPSNLQLPFLSRTFKIIETPINYYLILKGKCWTRSWRINITSKNNFRATYRILTSARKVLSGQKMVLLRIVGAPLLPKDICSQKWGSSWDLKPHDICRYAEEDYTTSM